MLRGCGTHSSDEDRQVVIRSIVKEFEGYRDESQAALGEQVAAWRRLTALLFGELLASLAVDPASEAAAPLLQLAKRLAASKEIDAWGEKLNGFLHPQNGRGPAQELAERLKAADCTTANDNAAGLRGAGSAVEHLRKIMAGGGDGFIVLFRLNCLDVISQRFGPEAVEDCLMSVSAFLTAGLESDDAIFHWSDSALLAILRGRYSEFMVAAELDRMIAQNRREQHQRSGPGHHAADSSDI